MKRWALVTVVLYLIALVGLTAPVFIDCFRVGFERERMTLGEVRAVYSHWGYWVWIGVSLLGQVLLLLVPVAAAEGRPQRRRRLLVPVITSAGLMAFVCVSAIAAVGCGIWGDHNKMFELFGKDGVPMLTALVLYLTVTWAGWALIFRRFLKETDPEALIRRLMRWLLAGSILELLVAVPSHVIVRHRGDCCAPAVTFWGIATGITVMLMSYGPGVYFLFVKRMRDLRPKTAASPKINDQDRAA